MLRRVICSKGISASIIVVEILHSTLVLGCQLFSIYIPTDITSSIYNFVKYKRSRPCHSMYIVCVRGSIFGQLSVAFTVLHVVMTLYPLKVTILYIFVTVICHFSKVISCGNFWKLECEKKQFLSFWNYTLIYKKRTSKSPVVYLESFCQVHSPCIFSPKLETVSDGCRFHHYSFKRWK